MAFSDSRVEAIFGEYRERHEREQALMSSLPAGSFAGRRDEFLLPVGKAVGDFLHALVLGRSPQRILELGTSYGYSTLFLADAARLSGSKVVSIDVDPDKQAYAANMMARAGLADHVEFRCGDALEILAADDGAWGVVLLDIWKELYLPCFEAFYPNLSEQGIIVSDNMIHPVDAREDVRRYRAAVVGKPDLQTVLLPLGSGIELSVKWSVDSPAL